MKNKVTILETFDNQYPQRDYVVTHFAPEFTSVCPKTGQPDFAEIIIEYIPDKKCVELKSLKLYLNSFRNDGIFYESVVNFICDDLIKLMKPRYIKVIGEFKTRGGIESIITVEHNSKKKK
ncbi:MAG: NADPH-dependent 7-cyano-7-deazaguanine reductase QueF [Ignavibacteria bacterium]|nr:NADPH-dependent 7-cyano-7-deazaguanine reductase QueF [Ignavibacteria bacterium]